MFAITSFAQNTRVNMTIEYKGGYTARHRSHSKLTTERSGFQPMNDQKTDLSAFLYCTLFRKTPWIGYCKSLMAKRKISGTYMTK